MKGVKPIRDELMSKLSPWQPGLISREATERLSKTCHRIFSLRGRELKKSIYN